MAIASCFLPVEKSNEQVRLKNELAWPLEKLKETAKQLAEVRLRCWFEYLVGFLDKLILSYSNSMTSLFDVFLAFLLCYCLDTRPL